MSTDEKTPTLTDVEQAIKAAKEAEQKIIELDHHALEHETPRVYGEEYGDLDTARRRQFAKEVAKEAEEHKAHHHGDDRHDGHHGHHQGASKDHKHRG